ncbi:DUF6266 family protein [Daejeonella sp.]|uniref:DUF6266 family protein n=1 Tax=Daejeonella sp. TaxID=2805397 RepID=UPI0030BD8D35
MARLNRGPNGPPSGKFGSVIGSSWRGIYYIKGLQKEIKKARSPLQIAQQNKFAVAVKFLNPVKSLLDIGFSRINPGGATGYNMAISYTVQNCIKGNDPDFEIDYPSVVFCTKGKLTLPENIQMELNGLNLKVSWHNIKGNRYSSPGDLVEVLIFDPQSKTFQAGPDGSLRNTGELTVSIEKHFQGSVAHVYLYLIRGSVLEKKEWSNSVYLGPVKFRD